MKTVEAGLQITPENLGRILTELNSLYGADTLDEGRKQEIAALVRANGYVPYSHIRALKELSDAETIVALEEKLKMNNTYSNGGCCFDVNAVSPVKRAGFNDASWFRHEQHNIKLINLAGLGDGNTTKEPGAFIDWLRQLVTLPAGKPEDGVLATTVYLIPFHPREFGCAYIPKHSGVSPALEDKTIKDKLNLGGKDQVRLFISLCQLCGHPAIYDVLPQTGRFSKITLSNPYAVRWFDVKELISELTVEIEAMKNEFKSDYSEASVDEVAKLLIKRLSGEYLPVSDELQELFDSFTEKLMEKKKELSNKMMQRGRQTELSKRATKIINEKLGKAENEAITEEDISDDAHGEIIGTLISEGLWPAGGGAWCSAGVPIFNEMSEGGGYPTFKHYDWEGKDVTHFANLDCQAPYYFACLENGQYNEEVIEFYINFLKKLQKDYNFDGFRVDHIDHVADAVSENNGAPISYRAPRRVLRMANEALKKDIPYFATLAEYMLWDNLYEEYHEDMKFDALWGNDIISQYRKDVAAIIADNAQLAEYNSKGNSMTILKIYNNQDGEFREINQYPGQMGEAGALFKWFKLKFIPGGKSAQRPVMFIDGDESFTKTGIERVIMNEESMIRDDKRGFYDIFNAIDRFALNSEVLRRGKAYLYNANAETGFASWIVEAEGLDKKLFVVANERPPQEMTMVHQGRELPEMTMVENHPINNVKVELPQGTSVLAEYVYDEQAKAYVEKAEIRNLSGNVLTFESLAPAEFHFYKIA